MVKKCIAAACFVLATYTLLTTSCQKSAGGRTGGGQDSTTGTSTDTLPSLATVRSAMVDKQATDATTALWYNLQQSSKSKVLFGHQDDTYEGHGWQAVLGGANTESDVNDVTGSYPAVYGSDFIFITSFQYQTGGWYDWQRQIIRQLSIDAYKRGGINTYSWHYSNPIDSGSFYWSDSSVETVSQILPGGNYNLVFRNSLQTVANHLKSLVSDDGSLVPVIFRPWHEADGSWFWWGSGHCTASDYKRLYQYTVTYLRDSLQVHNLIYAWSPGPMSSQQALMGLYPGDQYVDVIGCDYYFTSSGDAAQPLKVISDYATQTNKIAALTETGLDKLTQTDWYTQVLLKSMQSSSMRLAYAMAWGNTTDDFYTPYKGGPGESDFIQFKNNAYIGFGSNMPDMYHIKK